MVGSPMIELNYCPQCARAKLGRFCAGCGLNLDQLADALAGGSSAAATPAETQVEEIQPPAPPGTGVGLVYGEEFNPQTDCLNCGATMPEGRCPLCSE